MPPRKFQKSLDPSFFRHSKLVLSVIVLLIFGSLLFGGSFVSIGKVPLLHGAAPSSQVDERVQNLLADTVFLDVPSDYPNAYAIAYLKNLGLVEGYDEHHFKPDKVLDRAEFMVFLVKALRVYPYAVRYSYCFDDVGNEWFAPAICFAKNRGWIEGNERNLFRPGDDVTQAVALKVVLTAFNVKLLDAPTAGVSAQSISRDDWYAPYAWTAAQNGWLGDEPELFNPDATMTRAELAQLLYKIMISELPPI